MSPPAGPPTHDLEKGSAAEAKSESLLPAASASRHTSAPARSIKTSRQERPLRIFGDPPPRRGRSATVNPHNRFERLRLDPVPESREVPPQSRSPQSASPQGPPTQLFHDNTKSALSKNESPDLDFTYSINPYRGCEHGCAYCYARPTHEYLGFSSGLDFESKIVVKKDLPNLLRRRLASRSFTPQTIVMSGVTDPYQPIERRLRVTRACLEVLVAARNPVAVVTKNHLVTRDIDLYSQLAAIDAAAIMLSVTTLDPELSRRLEPRASSPQRRLAAIRELSAAGIPVGVMVAPVIPGLTDHEIPSILTAAKEAGAASSGYTMCRLPGSVTEVFTEWLRHHTPQRAEKVLHRIAEAHGQPSFNSGFGRRMRGDGPFARQISELFHKTRRKLGLDATFELHADETVDAGQLRLF